MKRLITLTIPITLAACTTLGNVEKQALHDRAIADARSQPKEIHLAYLQCYALRDVDKDSCKRKVKQTIEGRNGASTWEYILPFDYEAERLGFQAFLRDHGKSCAGIDKGPEFNSDTKAYDVICTDGHRYAMRFDYKNEQWELAE
ncbi:MAG: hypothetical protein H6908_03510 [Hyphomicrobiales bacterium]|nr:hypothetical protein [Rickettsiales bacterium]MCP5361695.1 hypothetical protein [Hyphomicrobiales bacterium]